MGPLVLLLVLIRKRKWRNESLHNEPSISPAQDPENGGGKGDDEDAAGHTSLLLHLYILLAEFIF